LRQQQLFKQDAQTTETESSPSASDESIAAAMDEVMLQEA
jgi:hypothetical protein